MSTRKRNRRRSREKKAKGQYRVKVNAVYSNGADPYFYTESFGPGGKRIGPPPLDSVSTEDLMEVIARRSVAAALIIFYETTSAIHLVGGAGEDGGRQAFEFALDRLNNPNAGDTKCSYDSEQGLRTEEGKPFKPFG